MSIGLSVLGIIILLGVTLDIWITTLTVGGGGPITSRLSSVLWKIALKIHRRYPNHRALATVGLSLLVLMTLLWFALTWLGWTLVFLSGPGAVITASGLVPASFWERVYFVGYTLSTLGQGNYQPQGSVWQMATVLASLNGFFMVTLIFAYLIPVVSAASDKRSCATYISSLGGTADEIVMRAWNGQNFGQFDQHLIALSGMLTRMGENHLTYPVLHYFHSIERSRSMALSLVALDDALTLLQYGIPRHCQPDPAALRSVRRSSSAFLATLKSAYLDPTDEDPPLPALALVRLEDIPTLSDSQFQAATEHLEGRRRILLELIQNEGWRW
ncbi:MAG: potassium channel family protein, partial [Cyanobacteriota bacterium]|nr:potassium channel family protein [Cyanobacteriota bacterium]